MSRVSIIRPEEPPGPTVNLKFKTVGQRSSRDEFPFRFSGLFFKDVEIGFSSPLEVTEMETE